MKIGRFGSTLTLFMLAAVAVVVIGAGERTGYYEFTITDAIGTGETAAATVRVDTSIVGPIELNGYKQFQYWWFAEIQDTNFTNDTTRVLLQFGILRDDTTWSFLSASVDTIVKHITSDTTTASPVYGLDTLPYDFIRFVVIARDSMEADKAGITGNEYSHACKLAIRRTKD